MSASRFALLFALMLASVVPLDGSPIIVGPERILVDPEPRALPGHTGWSSPPPLWNGSEWVFFWYDGRARSGTYAQQLDSEGAVRFVPNRWLAPRPPDSLVRLGAGYLLGTGEGSTRTDHELNPISTITGAPAHMVSNGREVLAWDDDLHRVKIISPDSRIEVDTSRLRITDQNSKRAVAAPGDGVFLLAWSGYGASSIRYNLIDTEGNVLLESPREITSSQSVDSLSATWVGDRFLLASTVSTPSRAEVWLSEIGQTGDTDGAEHIWTAPGAWHLAIFQIAPDTALLTWWDPHSERMQGLPIHEGQAGLQAFVLANQELILGSNGEGQLAAIRRDTQQARISVLDIQDTDNPRIDHLTDWIDLRYGVPDQRGLVASEGTDLVLWASPGHQYSEVYAGTLTGTKSGIVYTQEVSEQGSGYAAAPNGDRNLIVWMELRALPKGNFDRMLMAQIVDREATPASPPVEIGLAGDPSVVAHGDGWLVTSRRSSDLLLQYVVIKADGTPSFPARSLPAPLPRPDFPSVDQSFPTLARLGPSTALLLWQEGDFWYECHFLCPLYAPGIVRWLLIQDGVVVEDSLETRGTGTDEFLGLPSAAMAGQNILMTWIRQTAIDQSIVEAMMLDEDGSPVSEVVTLGAGPHPGSVRRPAITTHDGWFGVFWDGPEGSILGARVERGIGSTIEVESFAVADSSTGAFESTAVALDEDSAVVFYTRAITADPFGGTWQIVSRIVDFDLPDRRRNIRRR